MLISHINKAFIQVNPDDIKYFFNQEDQFQMNHQYLAEIQEWINLFALKSSDMVAVTLGDPDLVSSWINNSFRKKQYIWFKEGDELRQMIQQDQLIFIVNPSKELMKNISTILKPLLTNQTNNKCVLIDDEEVTINNSCKIIFIFNKIEEIYT